MTKLSGEAAAVWNMVQEMNRAWTQGDPADLEKYFHRDMVAITPVDRQRREGQAACIEGWTGFTKMARILSWEEIDPLVQVYGNAAVVTYYYDMNCEMNGQPVRLQGRDMFFLVKENGRWLVVADQFSSYP
jgi:ketosteroid isomerase-like protein